MEARNQEMWQELIETMDFDQLSNAERAFVLGFSTEDAFRSERAILLEMKDLHEDVTPIPLVLEEKKFAFVIPLYQSILAVAASFVLGFFIFRSNDVGIEIRMNQPLAIADTVFVEKLVIDTIIQTKTQTKYLQVGQQNSPVGKELVDERPNSILSNQGSFTADLSSTTLENKGTSAARDETLVLLQSWGSPN